MTTRRFCYVAGDRRKAKKGTRVDGLPPRREQMIRDLIAHSEIADHLGAAANLRVLAWRLNEATDPEVRRKILAEWVWGSPDEIKDFVPEVTAAFEHYLGLYDEIARSQLPVSRLPGGMWAPRPTHLHGDVREDGRVYDSKHEAWVSFADFVVDDAGSLRFAGERHRLIQRGRFRGDERPNLFAEQITAVINGTWLPFTTRAAWQRAVAIIGTTSANARA